MDDVNVTFGIPITKRIELHQGETFSWNINVKQSDGTAKNLGTGYTVTAKMRKAVKSNTVTATFVTTGSTLASGIINLALTAATTAALDCGDSRNSPASQYVYDVNVTSGTTVTPIIDYSTVEIIPFVSR
jgi:hypothetical protein